MTPRAPEPHSRWRLRERLDRLAVSYDAAAGAIDVFARAVQDYDPDRARPALTARVRAAIRRLAGTHGWPRIIWFTATLLLAGSFLAWISLAIVRRFVLGPVPAGPAAVPGVLPPVRIGERWLVDGWIMANAPLGRAAALGADTVYVLPCGGVEPYERLNGRPTFRLFDDDTAGRARMLADHGLPNGATAINQALVGALVARNIREEFTTWTPRLDVYLPPGPCVDDLPLFSFTEVPGLMDAARRLAQAWLPTARPVTAEEAVLPDRLTGVID